MTLSRILVAALLPAAMAAQVEPQRLTLQQAEEIALRNNPLIRAAQASAAATTQEEAQVRSAFYPIVGGTVTGAGAPSDTRIAAGGLNNPVIYSRFATGFTANQMITDFGRTSSLARSAGLRANAEFEYHKAKSAEVLLEVNRAYIAGLRAQAVKQIAEQTIAARQAIADHAHALAEAKLKSELDVRFAQVSLAEARLLLETAGTDRRAADTELSMALGYDQPRSFTLVEEPARELPSTDPGRLIGEAFSRRPDLAGRRFELEAALKTVEAERRLRYPAVSAVASFGAIPAYAEGLGNNHYAAAGLNISIPFLNGGLYKARRVEAEYRSQAARHRLTELEQRVARDIGLAVLAAQSAAQRITLSTQLVEQATLALELAQARYDLGLSSIVELSQAQLARTNAELQSATARYDYQVQRAVLDYHIGAMR